MNVLNNPLALLNRTPLDPRQCQARLQSYVNRYTKRGYKVIHQTRYTAQLVKPKQFSLFWFFICLGIFYIPFYLAMRDKQIYLAVNQFGQVKARK